MENREATNRRGNALFALIFGILAAGIVIAGTYHFRAYERNFRSEVENQLNAVAELKRNELAWYRQERLADATVFQKNPAFSKIVRRYLEHPDDLETRDQLRTWLSRVQMSYGYDRVMFLDPKYAKQMIAPEGDERGTSFVSAVSAAGLQAGKVVFEDFYWNEEDQRIYLKVLTPVMDEEHPDRVIGIVAFRIDPQAFIYPFVQQWPTASETAETLLVRRDGNHMVYLNDLKFRKGTALRLRLPLEQTDVPAVRAVLGQEGILEGHDYRGTAVITAARAVPDSPWFLVARMDRAEVFGPVRTRLWQIVTMGLLLLFSVSGAFAYIWRQQRVRFERDRLRATDRLRESAARFSAIADSTQDAILMIDASGAVTFWNPAAERILGHTSGEALGQNLHALIVPERYYEAHQAAFPEFVRTGRGAAVGKTLEFEARRKDGHEITVALSLSAVRMEGAWHAAGILRDITQRKREEAAGKRLLLWQQGVNAVQQSLLAPALLADKLRRVTEGIVRLFDADFCRIWLIGPGDRCERGCVHADAKDELHLCRHRDRCLHLVASSGRYTHIDGEAHRRVPFGAYKIGRIASGEDHKFLTNDAQTDPRVHNHEWARELGLVSFVGYQLRIPGRETMGVLALFAKHPILPAEDALLDGLSGSVAQALQESQTQEAMRERIRELNAALEHVKALQGIIPICMHCHKIRTDVQSWQKIEQYIEAHSDAHFSHGLCPECLERHYPA